VPQEDLIAKRHERYFKVGKWNKIKG